MEQTEIESTVTSIVHEQKTIDPDALGPDTRLDEVGIDSLDALNILFEVEDRFDISISDEEARELRTVRQIAESIERHLREKAG